MAKELNLYVRDIDEFRNPVSSSFPMEIREYDGVRCFVVSSYTETEVKLPNDFYLREFLDLDAADDNALLDFQNKWGYIEALYLKERDYDDPLLSVYHQELDSIGYRCTKEYIDETERVRDFIYDAEIAKYGFDNFIESDWRISPEKLAAVTAISVNEVRECVMNTQMFIKAIIDARRFGIIDDDWRSMYQVRVLRAINQMQEALDGYIPSIDILDEYELHHRTTSSSLLPLVYAQCLFGIRAHQRGEYKIRECRFEKCGKLFQLGRKGEGDKALRARPAKTLYCTAECQDKFWK